jgi:hypothetical protein
MPAFYDISEEFYEYHCHRVSDESHDRLESWHYSAYDHLLRMLTSDCSKQ